MNLKSLALSVAACTQQGKYFAPHLASSLVHQTRGAIATYSGRIWKHLGRNSLRNLPEQDRRRQSFLYSYTTEQSLAMLQCSVQKPGIFIFIYAAEAASQDALSAR